MVRKTIYAVGFVLLLAAAMQAQVMVPDPLPTFNLDITPVNLTSDNPANLHISAMWPNSCVPSDSSVAVDGNTVIVTLTLPCEQEVCQPVLSTFEFNVEVGPLAPGDYTVAVEVLDCNGVSSSSSSAGSFTGGLPAGGPDGEPNEPNVPYQLAPGDTVVLLQDMPGGDPNLRTGQTGVVICSDSEDFNGMVLVSWLSYTGGTATGADCFDEMPRSFPRGSATWVDTRTVPLGVPFNDCGVLESSAAGCPLLVTDDGLTFNLLDGDELLGLIGPGLDFDYGDRVRVQGLLAIARPDEIIFTCPEQHGDIYNPVILPCAPAGGGNGTGCCAVGYQPGDRVRLLVSNPPDLIGGPSFNLPAGTLGTVLCCDSDSEDLSVYVSWDNFTGGYNLGYLCDTPPTSYPFGSGWWVRCADITLVAGGGNGNGNGDGDGNGNGLQCTGDDLRIGFGNNGVQIKRDSLCPDTSRSFSTCVTVTVSANTRSSLSLNITPLAPFNGTWQGTITPDVVPAGQTNVVVCLTVQGGNLAAIPADQYVTVAQAVIQAVAAPVVQ